MSSPLLSSLNSISGSNRLHDVADAGAVPVAGQGVAERRNSHLRAAGQQWIGGVHHGRAVQTWVANLPEPAEDGNHSFRLERNDCCPCSFSRENATPAGLTRRIENPSFSG